MDYELGNNFENELYNSFSAYCINSDIDMIKSTILTKRNEISPFYDYIFALTCSTKNTEVIKFLLNEENISLISNLDLTLSVGLVEAARENQFENIQYLISLKKINENELLNSFKIMCAENLTDSLQYLIFDLNIEQTPNITKYLKDQSNEKIQNMFNIRLVNQELNKELNIPKIDLPNKKSKL